MQWGEHSGGWSEGRWKYSRSTEVLSTYLLFLLTVCCLLLLLLVVVVVVVVAATIFLCSMA